MVTHYAVRATSASIVSPSVLFVMTRPFGRALIESAVGAQGESSGLGGKNYEK